MKFDLYCAAACRDEGDLAQLGACGYVLVMSDPRGTRSREFHFALGGSDSLLGEVQAARLALASIAPAYRQHPLVLHTSSHDVAEALVSPTTRVPSSKALTDLRRFFGFYRGAEVAVEAAPSPDMMRARQLAKLGLETQKDFDSGTITPGEDNDKV